MKHTAWLLLAAVACGHTEPFISADETINGPFVGGNPVRLTYSPFGDLEPGTSTDGNWITFQFDRGTPDGDRCLAAMPATGGQRLHEWCAWDLEESSFANGLANAAMHSNGMVAFTMHSGLINNMTSNSAGLYVGPVDSIAGAVRVLPFPGRPAGALTSWADLGDPIWIDDDEVVVLAGDRFLRAMTKVCIPLDCFGEFVPFDQSRFALQDTLMIGREIARLRISDGTASVVATRPVPDASMWSFDRSTGTAYILHHTFRTFDNFALETLADTIYAVDLAGGTPTLVYGTPRIAGGRFLERIHGIATGGGRIFLSRSWHPVNLSGVPQIQGTAQPQGEISEFLPDGSLRPVAPLVGYLWGRLRLSPDGRYLYAEALDRIGGDIYRIELDP